MPPRKTGKPSRSPKQATKPPKPQTFAAFVLTCPADASDADVAKLARDTGRFPRAEAKNVYHARWYYRSFIAKPDAPKVLKPSAKWKDGVIVSPTPKPVPAPARIGKPNAQLIAIVKHYGTDAVRAALAAVEQSAHRVAS